MKKLVIGKILQDGGIYSGEVNENELPHSNDGVCTWGNIAYEGCWIDGLMSGIGTLYESGKVKYRGFWWKGELVHVFGTEDPPKPEDKLPKNKNKIAALLVGCNYEGSDCPLLCCVNEVNEIGKKLSQIGVDVTVLRNASVKEIERGLIALSNKDKEYDNVLFYFSGHGGIYGGYHLLTDINGFPMALETNVVGHFCKSSYKNIIIIHDACNVILPITQDAIDDIHCGKQMFIENHMHERNILYAFSSLNGNPSWASGTNQIGMFALAFIENIHKKNVPVIKMFENITKFVVDYSKKEHDGVILEIPNITKALFDEEFCLYSPEE